MVDFVEEVEERLRAERYASFARRWLPWIGAAILALVIGWLAVWGWRSWQDRNIGRASVAYDQAMNALVGGDQTGAFTGLAGIAKDGPAGYRTLALMTQADLRLAAGSEPEAVALYDKAAAAAPNPILRDLAHIRAAQALMDNAPLPTVQARLAPLMGDKKPFNLEAREALAMAKLQAGQISAARGDFNALSLSLGVSQEMRQRAQGAVQLINSGQAARVAQVVRQAASPQAATMPPSPAGIPPSLLGGAAPDGGDAGPGDATDAPTDAPPAAPQP